MQMGFLQLQPFIILWSEEDMYKAKKKSKYSHFNDWVMIILQIG